MKENITILFFILILAFAGFGVYYYYKNSVVSNILSYGVSNSMGFQVLGSSDGISYLAAQVGGVYESINISIYATIYYEGPEPFRVDIGNFFGTKGIWEYISLPSSNEPNPNYNYTYAYSSKRIVEAYSNSSMTLLSRQLQGGLVFSNLGYQNGTIYTWNIILLVPPKINVFTVDAAGNEVRLSNSKNCKNLLSISITLQALMVYDVLYGAKYFMKVLGIDSAGSGWCPV